MYFLGSEILYSLLQIRNSLWGNFMNTVRYANSTKYEYVPECETSEFFSKYMSNQKGKITTDIHSSVCRHIMHISPSDCAQNDEFNKFTELLKNAGLPPHHQLETQVFDPGKLLWRSMLSKSE
jgi:hypothetical protein